MNIYAVWNIPNHTFLRWGVNGGGREGYCLFGGHKCFFNTHKAAEAAISQFVHPEDYEIRKFAERDGE